MALSVGYDPVWMDSGGIGERSRAESELVKGWTDEKEGFVFFGRLGIGVGG